MKLLVTGAGGLLGRAAVRLASKQHDCVPLSRQDMDVTDQGAVEEMVHRFEPDAVLHCAAFTNVDLAEQRPESAFAVNVQGSEWVARAARKVDAQMVYVSTDYVFDGEQRTPYTETDRLNPLSQYGRSKLEGEQRVKEICGENHTIVRSGWLYGRGKGFVDWVLERLASPTSSEPIRVVDDQVGSPTWVSDLARAMLLLTEERFTGTFHFVNQGETDWLRAARLIADLHGFEPSRLVPTASADLRRPAPRPPYSALDVGKYERATGARVRSWNDALTKYVSSVANAARME